MRSAERTLSLILAAFLAGASAHAGQLIQDPSFELGPGSPYWTCSQYYWCTTYNGCGENPQSGIAIINTWRPYTGTYSALLVSSHEPEVACKYLRSRLSQVFTIPSNVTSATLNFWVLADGGNHKLWVELYDAVSGVKYATLAVLDGWILQFTSVTVPGLEQWKGAQVRLLFRTAPIADDNSTDWFVDDVTVSTTP